MKTSVTGLYTLHHSLGRSKLFQNRNRSQGFTLVELLIVIVVIAILAAITIIAYNGITDKAHATALQTDLSQDYTVLANYNTENGAYPGDQTSGGLKASSGVTLGYNVDGGDAVYCLQATGWGLAYFVTDQDNTPQVGHCSGTTGVVATVDTVVSTLAGNGTEGTVNGQGTATEFDFYDPTQIAIDASGNLYVPNQESSQVIRKVTPGGLVSTYTGTGDWGYADGTLASAQFRFPVGATVAPSGAIYVADGSNDCIRVITTDGNVGSFAGDCAPGGSTRGFQNGTGTGAWFNWPNGVAADSSGDVYVVDSGNDCIRKITSAAVVTTFAGSCTNPGISDGTGESAGFDFTETLGAIAIDDSGNLFVADSYNNCIRKITPAGAVTTLAGTCVSNTDGPSSSYGHTDGTGSAAQFAIPDGIAVDAADNVYVADTAANCIRKITPAAVVSTIAGTCLTPGDTDGTGTAAQFGLPEGIVLNRSTNTLYVADAYYFNIRAIKL